MAYIIRRHKSNGKKIRYTSIHIRRRQKCNSWFTYLGRIVSSNVIKVIIVLLFISLIISTFLVDYYHADVKHNDFSSIYMLIINSLLASTILIYLFASKNYNTRINNTIFAFRNRNFRDICKNYYRWIMYRKSGYDKITEYDKKRRLHNYQHGIFRNKNRQVNSCILVKIETNNTKSRFQVHFWRFVFMAVWMLCAALLLYYTCSQTKVINTVSQYPFYFFFTISMLLLSYSYYHCILNIAFLYKLSCSYNRRDIRDYDYNIYKPSETIGYRQLLSDINFNTILFLSISLTYISSVFGLIRLRNYRSIINILENHVFFAVIMLYGVFCVLSSIIVYLVPKMMLRRILTNWAQKSRQILTKELDKYLSIRDNSPIMSAEYLEAERMVSITQERITGLKKEVSVFRHDTVNIIISSATLLAPIISIIVSISLGN